jgi:hypothetical protein
MLINGSRAPHGRAALSPRSDMTLVSRRWSAQMARENRRYHNPSYSSRICCWRRIAENVAWTSTGSHSAARTRSPVREGWQIHWDNEGDGSSFAIPATGISGPSWSRMSLGAV